MYSNKNSLELSDKFISMGWAEAFFHVSVMKTKLVKGMKIEDVFNISHYKPHEVVTMVAWIHSDTSNYEPNAGQYALNNNQYLEPLQSDPIKETAKFLNVCGLVAPVEPIEKAIILSEDTQVGDFGTWTICKDDFMEDDKTDQKLIVSNCEFISNLF